jgi:ubiquinone/menaquinone biosynthesis C-methylase UbiE
VDWSHLLASLKGRREMTVYEDVLAPMYDTWVRFAYTDAANDEQFYLEEAGKNGGPVLELGCGTGRITLPIAETGVSIMGLDMAPAMLEIARQKAHGLTVQRRQSLRYIEGDMRSFKLDKNFKLIIIPYAGFMHLLTTEDHQQALRCISDHLFEDGQLIFTTHTLPESALKNSQRAIEGSIVKFATDVNSLSGNRLNLWFGRRYDPASQLIETLFRVEEIDDAGATLNVREGRLFQYHFRPDEVRALLSHCGYKLGAVYGDYSRGPVRTTGERIWVAQKSRQRTG